MLVNILKFLVLYTLVMTFAMSAKILGVFPMPAISHQIVFRPLMQELARRGHEVTVITPDPAFKSDEAPANLKEIDVHNVSYYTWQKFFQDIHITNKKTDVYMELRQIFYGMGQTFKAQFESFEVQKLISNKNQKFDLIVLENTILSAFIFSHIYKAPIILVSTVGDIISDANMMGLPSHPLLYPNVFRKKLYNLSLTEKIKEIYIQYSFEYVMYLRETDANDLLQTLDPNIPPLIELNNNVDMLFLNVHSVWSDNKPVPPNVIFVGGMTNTPKKGLPKDLQIFLDSSKHGVIYFSFGTSVQVEMIPQEKVKLFFKVLSQFKYDILLKWKTDEVPDKPNNVKILQWFPQPDILKHPKVKLFITQAGLLSTYDAITAGVPLIAFPMLVDQWHNSQKCVKHGIGIQLDINTVTEEEFKNAIESIIKNDSYQKNMKIFQQQFLDQPEEPLQRAVWWTEYVIRHGGAKHLRSPAANLSYMQYFEVEVVCIVLFSVVVTILLSISILVFTLRLFKSIFVRKNKIKNN